MSDPTFNDPELEARRTAAAAALADYRAAADKYLDGSGEVPYWADWAYRLAAELASILHATADTATLTQADLATIRLALADGVWMRTNNPGDDDLRLVASYAALRHRLGDDQS
jgi:hypothetical protein